MRAILLVALSLAAGCDTPRAVHVDAARADAATVDAGTDPGDAGPRDASVIDASLHDASVDAAVSDARVGDAGSDAGRDAGSDAAARDAGPAVDAAFVDGGPLGTLVRCAPSVPDGPSSGIGLSSNFWSGFRFELPSGGHITRIGAQLSPDGAGTIFGTLVRLTGASDMPDDPAVAGGDVVMRTLLPVPATTGAAVIVTGSLDVTIPPGWYAVVFGTGAFGGTASGTFPSGGGRGCIASPGSSYPFTIRQSDGMFILQGAEPHFFVELAP